MFTSYSLARIAALMCGELLEDNNNNNKDNNAIINQKDLNYFQLQKNWLYNAHNPKFPAYVCIKGRQLSLNNAILHIINLKIGQLLDIKEIDKLEGP